MVEICCSIIFILAAAFCQSELGHCISIGMDAVPNHASATNGCDVEGLPPKKAALKRKRGRPRRQFVQGCAACAGQHRAHTCTKKSKTHMQPQNQKFPLAQSAHAHDQGEVSDHECPNSLRKMVATAACIDARKSSFVDRSTDSPDCVRQQSIEAQFPAPHTNFVLPSYMPFNDAPNAPDFYRVAEACATGHFISPVQMQHHQRQGQVHQELPPAVSLATVPLVMTNLQSEINAFEINIKITFNLNFKIIILIYHLCDIVIGLFNL